MAATTSSATPPLVRALAFAFVGIALGIALGFARTWLPPVATAHGGGIDGVIGYLLVTTGLVFLAGHFVLSWLVVRFHAARGAVYRPESARLQWAWAMVPLLLFTVLSEVGVIAMGTSVWVQLYGPPPANALEVEIVGKQFEWICRYPGADGKFGRTAPELVHDVRNPLGLDEDDAAAVDDVVVRGELRLPVGRPVVLRMRTHDVLHSFTVPHFRVKQDLVPGFPTRVQFEPIRTGTFEIACAELCGLGHYKMRGLALIQEASEFQSWLASQRGWFQ